MTKRRKLALIGVAVLTAILVANFYSSDLIGWWRGEASYRGRYTNSWRAELASYEFMGLFGGPGDPDRLFVRVPTKWDKLLERMGLGTQKGRPPSSPPLQDGHPEGVQVLVELLQAPEANVRVLAARGLERIGPRAREAIPALLALVDDDDDHVPLASQSAIEAIDPRFGK